MTRAVTSLIGHWYATGPADSAFDPEDRRFSIHVIVADPDPLPGCVTVRNGAGQTFPLARMLALDIAVPPPVAADNTHLRRHTLTDDRTIRTTG